MGALENSNSILEDSILKENKSFNYKLLSRKLDIHVNDAKKLLYTFYLNHQKQVKPTYIISGKVRGLEGQTIKLTTDLDDKDKFYKIDSVQVYSLSPLNIKIEEAITSINKEISQIEVTEEGIQKWGLIKGPDLIPEEHIHALSAQPSRAPQAAARAKTFPSTSISTSTKQKNEPEPKAISLLDRFRQRQAESDNTKRSQAPIAKQKEQATTPSTRAHTDSTHSKIKNKDRELTPKQKIEAENRLKKQKELESMFDDDDDDVFTDQSQTVEKEEKEDIIEEMKDVLEKEHKKPEGESQNVEKVERPKMEDLEDIFNSSLSEATQPPKSSPSKEKVAESKESISTYVDEDGYIVTKRDTAPKAKAKAKPKARSATPPASSPATKKSKTSASTKQSSLLNFFGKK